MSELATDIDPLDRPVWYAKNFGPIINRTTPQVFALLEAGLLDATKVQDLWTSTPRRLLRSVGVAV
jgi:hypothetical protein